MFSLEHDAAVPHVAGLFAREHQVHQFLGAVPEAAHEGVASVVHVSLDVIRNRTTFFTRTRTRTLHPEPPREHQRKHESQQRALHEFEFAAIDITV